MRCNLIAWAAVALIGAAPFATARADVLFDNSSQAIVGSDPLLNETIDAASAGPIAASFSTGSQGVYLSAVEVALEASSPLDGGSVSVSLWSDSGSGPGTLLDTAASVADSSLSSSSFNLVSLSFAEGIVLESNTRYWVELGSIATSALWGYDGSGAGTNVLNEYTWNNYAGQPPLTANSAGFGSYVMQVNAVPEPGCVLLLGSGVIALAFVRRARRRSAISQMVA